MPTFLTRRKKSFRDAFRGINNVAVSQVNFRIHLSVLALVIIAGLLLKIKVNDWIAIVLSAGLVLAAESLNTALEFLGDAYSMDENPGIGKAKDAAAAGVLLAATAAAIVGLMVFIPAIMRLFG